MSLIVSASLIVTPNGYKEGKLYSVIPSDGSGDMSVVRATTATRVNSAGLVELVPYNLFEYSEQFQQSYWQKSSSTITANNTTAPDGTLTADRLNITGGYGSVYIYPFDAFGNIISASCYFKKGTANTFYIENNPSSGYIFASFNLDTEVISPSAAVISSSIENVGDGWYRCSLTAVSSGTSFLAFGIYQNTSGLTGYLWGAQVNEGTLKPYQKTETRLNIPRLDYSNGTCPSLLVEPQRTNLLTYSEQLSNWTNIQFVTVTDNVETAPNGNLTASRINETAVTNVHRLFLNPTVSANKHTYSVYLKAGTRNWAFLRLDGLSIEQRTWFDIQNGTIGTTSGDHTATIEDAGNGWYRCSVSIAGTTYDTTPLAIIGLATANGVWNYAGDVNEYIYAWGAQLELGSYSTSYIPTTSASVTRNADVISKTGISSLIGQTEGTIYLENSFLSNDLTARYFTLSDGTNTKRIIFDATTTSNQIRMVVINSTIQAEIFYTLADITAFNKIAIKYKANDFALFVNGVLVGSDTSGTVPSGLNTIKFSNTDNGVPFYGKVKALALWSTALTNDELATLTTI